MCFPFGLSLVGTVVKISGVFIHLFAGLSIPAPVCLEKMACEADPVIPGMKVREK